MPSKKTARTQARVKLKRLRELGLISRKTDLRKAPSRAQLKNLKKFTGVLTGKERVVAVTKGSASYRKAGFVVRGRRVVIPKGKGERIKYNAKTERIEIRKRGYKRVIFPTTGKAQTINDFGPLKPGKRRFYVVPLGNGGKYRNDNFQDLQDFIGKYKNAASIMNYLEVEDVDDFDGGDE